MIQIGKKNPYGMGGPECDSSAQQLVHLCPKAEYNWEISAGFRMQ